jgi:membrane protein
MRYRVTGLAAEAAYFALLSLPPLVLSLAASIGFIGGWLGPGVTADFKREVLQFTGHFLTSDAVATVIRPTLNDVINGRRIDVLSFGFLLALWSGSRVLNVFVDTVSIMYGLGGHRGIVRTRALSLTLYVLGLLVAVVIIPMVLLGPGVVSDWSARWVGSAPSFLSSFSWYWLIVIGLTLFSLTSLYYVATPVRTPWRRDLPGALLALVLWSGASYVLRIVLAESVGGTSIYGPLSAPILVLIWLYSLAITVLIGAALNAAVAEVFPGAEP